MSEIENPLASQAFLRKQTQQQLTTLGVEMSLLLANRLDEKIPQEELKNLILEAVGMIGTACAIGVHAVISLESEGGMGHNE